jgi:hypothetical protein
LIASQLSNYKNALLIGIINHLKARPAFIKVVDITALTDINDDNWDAIVVIHTWEDWAPPPAVETWFEQDRDLDKIVVLTTSGNAQYKMNGINAITSASLVSNIPADIEEIVSRLDIIFSRMTMEKKSPGSIDIWQQDYPPSFP